MGTAEQFDEFRLPRDLRIALNKKRQINALFNHLFEKLRCLGILVEVIRREHDKANASSLGCLEALDGGLNTLASDSMTGDLNDRTKVAGERTTSRRIDTDHRNEISA